jgi:hypothetical protein
MAVTAGWTSDKAKWLLRKGGKQLLHASAQVLGQHNKFVN